MNDPLIDALADLLAALDFSEDDEPVISALAAALVDLDLDADEPRGMPDIAATEGDSALPRPAQD